MINTHAVCMTNEYRNELKLQSINRSKNKPYKVAYQPLMSLHSSADAYKCSVIFDVIGHEGSSLEKRAIVMQDFVTRVIENTLSPMLVDKMPYQVYSMNVNKSDKGTYYVDFQLRIHLKRLPVIESLPENVNELTPIKESQDFSVRIGKYTIINDEVINGTDIQLSVQTSFRNSELFSNFSDRMNAITNNLDKMEREVGQGATRKRIEPEYSYDSMSF